REIDRILRGRFGALREVRESRLDGRSVEPLRALGDRGVELRGDVGELLGLGREADQRPLRRDDPLRRVASERRLEPGDRERGAGGRGPAGPPPAPAGAATLRGAAGIGSCSGRGATPFARGRAEKARVVASSSAAGVPGPTSATTEPSLPTRSTRKLLSCSLV